MGMGRPARLAPWMVAIGMGALVAGCTVGPDYVRPTLDLGGTFPSAPPRDASGPATATETAGWWRALGDPALTQVIERALAANADLEAAAARVAQSRAELTGVKALALPIGQAGAAALHGSDSARSPEGQLLSQFRAPLESDLYAGGLAVTWETDLFGKIRRGREARAAQAQMDVHELQATRVAVAAQTARVYVILRGLQQRRAILRRRLVAAERALTLTQRRAVEGEGAGLYVRQAEAQVASLRAALPVIDAAIAQSIDSLDVLQGQPLGTSRSLLSGPPILPVGLAARVVDAPAAVVARRPDVAAAERAVAAANAGIGVAVAEYYPQVSLAGLAGLSSTQSAHLLDSNAGLWAGGAAVQWRLLDWGRIGADVAAAKGRKAEALAVYRRTAETAAAEIDVALAQLQASAERSRRIDDLTLSVARARAIADRAHAVGETTLAPGLEAEDRLCAAEDERVQAQVTALQASIDLYRALGGV
ncbi:MAG: efflux transporter outer membrane subunit [Caulobacteraceae bacterium]|nr:efflux transporter outer membrane subunit [Caulobacteraceae bacterium]